MEPKITVTGGELEQSEIDAYLDYLAHKFPHKQVIDLEVRVDGEDVELSYTFAPEPFERIRRITGYLVGDMSRWNDAKRAEEHDRVKHNV